MADGVCPYCHTTLVTYSTRVKIPHTGDTESLDDVDSLTIAMKRRRKTKWGIHFFFFFLRSNIFFEGINIFLCVGGHAEVELLPGDLRLFSGYFWLILANRGYFLATFWLILATLTNPGYS